jgi:hypothetical protein
METRTSFYINNWLHATESSWIHHRHSPFVSSWSNKVTKLQIWYSMAYNTGCNKAFFTLEVAQVFTVHD